MRRQVMTTAAVGLALLFGAGSSASAAEIKVMASNALTTTLEALAPAFEKTSEHKVTIQWGAAAPLKAEIEKGASFDVAILTVAGIDDLIKQGKLTGATRVKLADSGAGVAVRKGAPKPDISTVDAFKRALLSAKSVASVQALGRALTSPDLKGSTFVVAGHTDAAGGEAYNQELSERRADSIKRYLVDKYSIAAGDLVTVGYGKSKLKDPNQPMAEVNRRVQVVNMENKTTASK